MVIPAISPARSARVGHGGRRHHDLVKHSHFNAQLLPSVRPFRAAARSATLVILLQMLGVWAAAWAALASVSSMPLLALDTILPGVPSRRNSKPDDKDREHG
jgi:hypothetical protein